MLPARFPRPRFSLNTIFLLTLGFALGYAWNLWIWRLHAWPGTEANMLSLPTYVIEPPDMLRIDVTSSSAGAPAITGQHLVSMDGRVNLGQYGSVYVAGMTIAECQDAIKKALADKVEDPQVVVDVDAYNSKVYYVVTQSRGFGDDVTRLPITGNETVLDAIAQTGGLKAPDSTEVWIARPAPNGLGPQQILPVDWKGISAADSTAANYQLFPGDRVFVSQKPAPAETQ